MIDYEGMRRHRILAGLSQTELEDEIGCTRGTVSQLENGRAGKVEAVIAAAAFLGLSLEEYLGLPTPEPPKPRLPKGRELSPSGAILWITDY